MNIITDDMDWSAYEVETEAAAKVRPASEFLAEMIDAIGRPEQHEPCAYLPWEKTHKVFAIRQGEVTLWAGVNGHGKSLVTGMVGSSLVAQGEKVCVASFEMKPKRTLHRMLLQFSGQPDDVLHPDEAEVIRSIYDDFRIRCEEKLWLYDQQGTVTPERVIAVTRYCFKELGIKHMFVDSLMKCVKGEDDYNGQKALVDELCAIARDYSAHIHLVHHLRKSGKETDLPDKSDVKGSGSIVDQVDNLVLVWRNKNKELDRAAGKLVNNEDADTVLFVRKQRNGTGWEGPIRLFFDKPSMQFTSEPNRTMDMVPWPHREIHRELP